MRYGILGEDPSDVATLCALVRRIAAEKGLRAPSFAPKGYAGWAKMFEKGAAQLRAFEAMGCNRVIVCCDADGPDAEAVHRDILTDIFKASGVSLPCCSVVPVQEIEVWLLADLKAVTQVIKSWKPGKPIASPEAVPSPKEHLIKLTRDPKTHRARYSPPVHNERVAEYLSLGAVGKKCPSFRPLAEFIT